MKVEVTKFINHETMKPMVGFVVCQEDLQDLQTEKGEERMMHILGEELIRSLKETE
jgi:hypothetical protein